MECGNNSGQNGPFGELVSHSRFKCIFAAFSFNILGSVRFRQSFLVKASYCDSFHERIESESHSESINCGDMAKFLSNRCHTPCRLSW
jgi:hypothetical protein